MKSIKISEKNWKKLMILKLKEGFQSLDEIIGKMLKNSDSIKKEELKNEKSN